MREIECTASNFEEWLKELEVYEDKQPESDYYCKVSVRILCKLLRIAELTRKGEDLCEAHGTALVKIATLQSELERVKEDRVTISGIKYAWKDGYYKLQSENNRLREALEKMSCDCKDINGKNICLKKPYCAEVIAQAALKPGREEGV